MKWPSEKYHTIKNITPQSKWSGPCADSFCYASCDLAQCRYELRLADSPHKHNIALAKMRKQEQIAAKELLNGKTL